MAHFPCQMWSFALANFVHATKESAHMEALKIHTFPKRQFDPNKVAYNVTSGVKLNPYNHDVNHFEYFLKSTISFEQALEWEKENLKHEDFQRF